MPVRIARDIRTCYRAYPNEMGVSTDRRMNVLISLWLSATVFVRATKSLEHNGLRLRTRNLIIREVKRINR